MVPNGNVQSILDADAESVALRTAAIFAIGGAIATIVASLYHPSREDPSDHLRVFQEYAASSVWVADHLVQFAGFFFMFACLIALSYSLAIRPSATAILARLGASVAIACIAVSAVLQGVDAIALKGMVDTWASAPDLQKDAAFAAAESVRWIEIGINSLFRLLQGTAVLIFGVALGLDRRYPGWLAWLGVLCGSAIVMRGFAVASTGFAPSNPIYSYSNVFVYVLLNIWLVALAILLWRESRRTHHLTTAGVVTIDY